MAADQDLGLLLAEAIQRISVLERASQAQHSTVETANGTVGLGDAASTAVDTAAALPAIEESAATAQDTADSVAILTDGWDDDLDDRLDEASADLDDARADLEDSQSAIEDAFGQTVDGLSADVDTAIRAAGDATTEAEAASAAALAASGLAASKGKTIVQVSAPTGVNADPANLWINISTDSNGVPKNQPNRYNPDTAKWEPITDSQAVTAAQAAATAVAAAQAAKDTADQANAAAAVAKQTATDANTQALAAAGIANSKGKVIPQVSKPTGANAAAGNLWIRTTDNTPWVYDSSIPDWVQVTDKNATDAAAAAVAAQQAATAAANAAAAAQATADGKPLILFSSTAGPSGTAPTGSIWFLWDAAKNVAGQWLQSGTLANPVWTPQQIRSEVIANLDVAKLTAGSAAIADLVAQKIAAATANFQTVNVSNLFVTSGATMAQATIDFLFTNVVQAKKITAGMIDATTFNGVTFTGAIFQTSATGKRVVLSNNRLNFYGLDGTTAVNAGVIEGIANGAGGGLVSIGAGTGDSALQIGTQALPTAGTASLRSFGVAWFDDIYAGGGTLTARMLRAPATSDASLTSTAHALQIGDDAGVNLIADNNEIMVRQNGVAASLFINADGGNVGIGSADSTITVAGLFNNGSLPTRMAVGQFTQAALGNGASNTTAISFPAGRFSRAPVVIPISLNSRYNVAMAGSTSTSGGSVTVSNWSGAGATASASIWWVAVQMSESSTFG